MILFFEILAITTLAGWADQTQCGYGREGCQYGFHDCHLAQQHGGRHKCGNCGNYFS